jgi:2'-5' RNA ligase
MRVTSHFIGVHLSSNRFADLFVDLQRYFRSHGLEDAVEFQNILSLHITLHYLGASITDSEKARILEDIASLSSDRTPTLSGLTSGYFGDLGSERVCYLGCKQNDELEGINRFFAEKYNYSGIPENQLKFVPHISLFRINDPDLYAPHRAKVDVLINSSMRAIDYGSLADGIRLFQVSSLFHPEIQIPVRHPRQCRGLTELGCLKSNAAAN